MATKSDLRSTTRDAHRAATQKAKWAHGIASAPGRHPSKPRPVRISDLAASKTRVSGSSSKAAGAANEDIADVTAEWPSLQVVLGSSPGGYSHSSAEGSEEDEEQEAVRMVEEYEKLEEMYGAEGTMPGSGSQVLHGALSKAIEAFEDKETVRIVKSEWAMLDEGGEEVGFVAGKRGKGKEREEEMCGGEFEMV
ncbi:hypothetical protein BDZ85DRAFT_246950 [Elsinoe ampelina]|uniref:Uncharacterized protein n=1 Tax=Elsinoe ampelina TaxID=302913 RepID=A0A6A6GLV8_9PEZI|nr:hypothetical protein BDZ85DRAFT_246950 [Elsinoe ampelina]